MYKKVARELYLTFIRSNATFICSYREGMICGEPKLVAKHNVGKFQT